MCRVSAIQLERSVSAPRDARSWTADHLTKWGLVHLEESAVLLMDELATNAVLHAKSRPVLSLAVSDGFLEGGCSDQVFGTTGVELIEIAHDEVSEVGGVARDGGGRGLLLVDALADEWGQSATKDGKHVWFRLSIGDWGHRDGCVCPVGSHQHLRLASGATVLHNKGKWDG
jgi:anti-sigma regulatory factor (Ser/Thr protein kinase)